MDRGPISPTERVRIKSSPTSVGLDLSANHPKPKSNDVGSPEDSCLYLSATEEKLIAIDNSNGSFLAHGNANKKKITKTRLKGEFFRELTK